MTGSNGFSMGFDASAVPEKIAAYQAKLLEIAKANVELSFAYAQAITTIKSPTEFTEISGEFSKKQVEMFKSHAKELTDFAMNRQP
jgi:hypothetical protein